MPGIRPLRVSVAERRAAVAAVAAPLVRARRVGATVTVGVSSKTFATTGIPVTTQVSFAL
jgi:hypothetical protein